MLKSLARNTGTHLDMSRSSSIGSNKVRKFASRSFLFSRNSSSLSLLSGSDEVSCAGLWSEMHIKNSGKESEMADTSTPRRSQIVGACYFKDSRLSRLFLDDGHEGVDAPNGSDLNWGELFVPEGCIRAAA